MNLQELGLKTLLLVAETVNCLEGLLSLGGNQDSISNLELRHGHDSLKREFNDDRSMQHTQ